MWKSPAAELYREPHQVPSAYHSLLCGFCPVGALAPVYEKSTTPTSAASAAPETLSRPAPSTATRHLGNQRTISEADIRFSSRLEDNCGDTRRGQLRDGNLAEQRQHRRAVERGDDPVRSVGQPFAQHRTEHPVSV